MSETPDNASAEFSEDDIRKIVAALESGRTPAEVAGVPRERLEALYALGHHLYSVGEFKDAETTFKSLCLYDYRDPRFWMGLGATLQAQERFAMAAEVYGLAGLASNLGDPSPFYYAALCHLKLGDLEAAEEILGSVQAMGKGAPKDEALMAKAANLAAVVKAAIVRKDDAPAGGASR